MQYWIALPIVLLSLIVLYTHRQHARRLLTPGLLIGSFAGLTRFLFATITNAPSPLSDFLQYAIFCSFAAWAGLSISARFSLPGILLRFSWKRQVAYTSLFALSVVLVNSLMLAYAVTAGIVPQWLRSLDTIPKILSISLQAGFVEETIFRLFSVPFLFWLFNILTRNTERQHIMRFAAVFFSACLFGAIHGAGFWGSFVFGIAFGYLFLSFGWLPCVVVHFLGDFGSFLYASRFVNIP
jgi:hypothetical protein